EPVAAPPGKPLLTILVDASASMATPDAGSGSTRYQAAARLAQDFAQQTGGRFEVRVRTFAGAAIPVELADLPGRTPQGQVTDLAAALRSCLEEQRPQGQTVLLLSDGIHNAGGGAERVLGAARVARALASPIFTRTFGGDAVVKDLAVEW